MKTLIGAISTGGVVAIVVGAVTVIAGAFYAVVNVQGERIKETRTDLNRRVDTLNATLVARIDQLDHDVDRRITDLGERIDQQFSGLGEQLESSLRAGTVELSGKIDTLNARATS